MATAAHDAPTPVRHSQPPPAVVERTWIPALRRPGVTFFRNWALRLVFVVVALAAVGLALPVLATVDRAVFDVINGIGYGPDWVFELLDPHERIYRGLLLIALVAALALRGPWFTLGIAVALITAATMSYALLEALALLTDRPRPQAVFEDVLKPPGADWAQASYPSGHATVTTAMSIAIAFALPAFRWPMIAFTLLIAWSRVAFGAHFPLDVLSALILGLVVARFSVAATMAIGLLPNAGARSAGQRTR